MDGNGRELPTTTEARWGLLRFLFLELWGEASLRYKTFPRDAQREAKGQWFEAQMALERLERSMKP